MEEKERRRRNLIDQYTSLLYDIEQLPEDCDTKESRELKDQADQIKWQLIELNKE